jgi:hypothetical protein
MDWKEFIEEVQHMAEEKITWIDGFKAITDGLFRKVMAILIVYGAGDFLFTVATKEGSTVQEMVIGYVFGVITTIIVFYYGTSQSSQDKEQNRIDQLDVK